MRPESDCGNTREGGCARLESGTAFMPGVSEKRLEKAARKEKDKCAKFRLLACLGRKKGHSIVAAIAIRSLFTKITQSGVLCHAKML